MANINDVEKLYNALKRDGYDDLGTLDEFTSRVSDRDKAQKLYEAMQRDGYDDLGTADDFFGRLNPQPAYKPTADELAGFQNTVNQAQQTVAGSRQAAKRIDARQKHAQKTNYGLTPPQVKLGENSKVVETDPHFNLDTGKMESTYITEQGNEYGSRAGADIEQNAVDIAKHMQTLPGQLQDAYAERERLQAEIEAETQRIGYGQSPERSFAPQVPGSIPRQSAERLSNDRLQTLYAAQRQNEERITALEAERDDDGSTQFWRGFVDAAKNPSTWTFGVTDLQNMTQLMRIKDKVDGGEQLTDDEETLLKNTMANGYAQQMFGENRGFMYRAGGISMQALPFVAEFVATGGFSSLTQMGASAGEKVAEKFALEGLKKTILRNTGVVMGDIASSFIMANTTGAARTGADIMERHTGQVTMDEEGNYKFEGGKGIGQSIYEGEVASTLEYYTEKLGEHLQLGNWIAKGADKMGLSKLSKAVGYLSNSKMLNAGGIQDYPSEVVEEQANLLLNAILVGDNNFSIDPNSKDFDKSVFNPKTQLDIWGGMLFSIGLMQAPRLAHTGYNAAGYYAYKHTTDVADANAAIVFGADNWQMIKEQIDNCDNEHFSELMQSVLDGGMNDMQKTATLNYAGNLLKMRGYNNGMMADVRGGEDFQSEEGFFSHGIDQGYQQGHEAQEPDEKKVIVDEANAAEQELSHMFSDQDMQWITNTDPMTAINVMLSNRGTNPGEWNDDEISAVVDYYQKQARAQGVMDAAADDVEYQVAKANAEVDANTHKAVNMMILAESGGEQFYIVGGDVGLTADVEEGKYLFDNERTGDALIVRNAETGEISVKSPQALSISLVHDPNQLKTANEVELRQQLVQQHEDEITFGSPAQEVFQLNDTVTLNDGQSNIIEGEIGMMPASIDGVYVVYTSDGRAMQLTGDDLNKMIIAHNGMEVQRTTLTAPVEQNEAVLEQETPPVEQNQQQSAQQQPEEEQPQSALDRIPFLQDEQGKPILNRKGKKQYQWHKASVEDTAEALTETTGGDMVLARDTATDLINNARGKLEKIRKQKPKGDDPIEIAESRAEIRRQEQEQQAIIKHWQDVNQTIQRKMQEESARRQAEIEAAKSEEQKAREAEEARIRKEKQDEIDRQRLREAIEKDRERRNKEYEPLAQARKDMGDDSDAMAILQDTEPRDLREWVSSLLRPHSFLWQDASESEIGLRSELGLPRSDMQRFMTLLGNAESGAKPFGKAVLDIYEGLPEGMKEQYDDQDVRNVVLDLLQSSNNSREMMNLTAENRIAEARETMKENRRREAEWEMEAWCEHYHLTPEERATFEDLMSTLEPPYAVEEDIINQIIADNEQNRTSARLDSADVSGGNEGELEGGESQVQGTVEAAGDGNHEEGPHEAAEAATGEPPVSGDNVAGGASADRESVAVLLDQVGASAELSERMSDYEVEQMNALIEDWDAVNSEYGEVIEQQKPALQSKNKATRDAAQKIVDEAQAKANEAFEPIEMYIEELNTKYGIESEEPFEGAIPTPKIDNPRYQKIRQDLIDAYASKDKREIKSAVVAIQAYVDEGLDSYGTYSEEVDDYEGDDPTMLADQYMIHVFQDRYLDDDEDQEYINTGLKASMREQAAPQQPEGMQPVTSFEDMVAAIPETVTDPAMQKALRKIVDKMFLHGSSNHRSDPRGFEYIFVYMADGTNKSDRGLLKPWESKGKVEYNDDNPTATWVDEKEQRIYFIKYNPQGSVYSWDFIITGYMSMPKPIGKTSTPEEIQAEEAKVDTNPTDAQKEAGNYQKGHINVDGYDITIENPKGSTRSGVDASGNRWESTMHNTYGYIRGTEGVDGDHIDVFLSDNPTSGKVFVVDQVNPSTGDFDEHKVMYGFASEEEARQAYLSNYAEGWKGLGKITEVSREEFKKWVESSHRKTKPFYNYKRVNTAATEILVKGGTILKNNIAGGDAVVRIVGSNINKKTGEREYLVEYYSDEQAVKERIAIGDATISQEDMRDHLGSDDFTPRNKAAQPKSVPNLTESVPNLTESVPETPESVPEAPANPSGNKLVTDERYEQLRERMKKKLLGQFNMGIDPEILAIGTEMAVYHIEKGARAFAEYAKAMIADLGDAIRPYLKAFYNGARDLPEMGELSQGMDDYAAVQGFDVFNFDKQKQPSPVEKAQQVVSQANADKEAAEAVQKIQEIAKKGSTRKGAKKPQQVQSPSLFDMFEEETKSPETETKPAKQETPAQPQQTELKLRPATEADIDSRNPVYYYQGKRVYIIAVMRSGEQISATQFSKPKIDSIMLTNGKSVKLEDLQVEDKGAKEPAKPNLDKKDYRTYMTPEAREYFANDPRFAEFPHPELAFVTAAVWDGVVIPVEELAKIPAIVEAEKRVKAKEDMPPFTITAEDIEQHAQHLLDAEHGSAVFENGKIRKVDGHEDFSGAVKQERKAFVVIGRPAGGKSSVFANSLSNKHGARIIDSDTVKEWFDEFDNGYGAGYVQLMSSEVAERALDIAAQNGDNIILPRIGGNSVLVMSAALRMSGYDVQLYYNDVVPDTSYMRSQSRFAMTGRYLSLDYLTSIKDKPSKIFSKFAEKSLGDYIHECTEEQIQKLRGRLERLVGGQRSDLQRALSWPLDEERRGVSDGSVSGNVERSESDGDAARIDLEAPIFSYAEWKSNDVSFGEKPKEIWNSKSGEPMPGSIKDNNNDNTQRTDESGPSGLQANGIRPEAGNQGRSEETGKAAGQESKRTDGGREGGSLRQSADQGLGHSIETTQGVTDGGEARGSSEGPSRTSKDGVTRGAVSTDTHKNRRNNVGERGKDYAPLSPKARFNANVQAIKIMRLLVDEGVEVPTRDQMEALRQYSGWGGMGTFFNDENSAENKILRDLLSEEEYNDAALSIKTAYYTPATVIDTLWDLAKAAGFKGGSVLEGSAGIGNILGQMPREMSRRSDIEAVELDAISGNILKLLYPDAKVHIQGFQDTVIPNGTVDLAITNVPFAADISVIDKVDKDLSRQFRQLHDFCIAKNIRKLKEGGIGIFITTSGTLDKSTKLREWIPDAGQTDVIGAFRLHNKTFGGTNVTSDIIVVRKRVNGQKSPNAIDISKATPLRVGTYEDKYHDEHQASMVVNDYFKDHPEMMAGEMFFGYEKGDTYRPGSYGLYPVEGKDQDKMLADFTKGIKEEETVQPQAEQEPVKNQLTAEKEGRMLIDGNGRLCVSERGVAVPLALNATKVKGQTKEQCFKDYQEVQKAVDVVLQQQLGDPDDAALKPKLDALNKAFDKFVKRYGYLHKNTSISFLRNDIDFPSFQALEIYKESKDIHGKVTVKTEKPKLFTQRVLGFKTEPQPKNIKDAVTASIFRSNSIDVPWIAERLGKSEEDVRNEILESRLGFEDPSTTQLEIRYKYLSGNVREKLAIAEAYNTDGKYAANVEELRKAVPMDIPSHLIEFSLGSSWIPMEIYNDYLKETFDLDGAKLTHLEGSWVLDEGYGYRNEKNRAAGIYSEQFRETIYGHQLVLAALNNRPVKVQKQVSEGYGSSRTTRTVTDQTATQACAVRVDEIKDEFKQYAKKKMQDNPELAAQVEKIYNEKFNALVPMQVDDDFLPDFFDGANTSLPLYGHQKRGVIRGLTSPTMLAHEVGTGKSFTLITTAMEMKRLGTAKKPMIVVQNATVAQMTADAKLLYPNARVLSLSEKDRSAEGRRSFYAKIKYNDWDLIIVPQSTFERIPDSPERELQFIQEKIDEKKHVIEVAEQSGMDSREIDRLRRELEKLEEEYGDTFIDNDPANGLVYDAKNGGYKEKSDKKKKEDAKRKATSLEKAKVKAQEQLDRAVDDVQYFDDLGVDALLIDEAHEYKHLGFQTSIGRGIKGIDPSYSKKCAGLYNKTRSVFEKAGWKNVVFATGTPISNTAAEIWTFMKYLMPADVMRANDIYYFDDFVHNFGNISQMLEFATSGKFKENTRFAAYVNKPELIRIWSQVADTVLTKEVGAVNEKIPAQEGGKDQDVFLPQSPSLIRIMNAVRKELERFENMTGKEKKENSSIPLTMYGIAKRAAIDPRLVDPEAPDEPNSKTNAAVREIVKDLEATKEYKGTVAVFCDNQNRLGRSGGKGVVEFNIYDDMKAKLVKAGVPESQIAIIKSGMSITAKQKVFDAVNSGDIRVVLGSTQTLGTGVNMQERLHLLIHMDAPDRPMDYTQRNGRIKRQGNLHKTWGKTIRVLRFGVEDSLDVTAYQRLKTKSGFIDSIMDGKGALLNNQVDRTVEEEEEGLFDNPVAVLSGSQYALKKNQAERELRKYQSKRAQWEADQVYVSNALRHNKSTLEYTQSQIAEEEKQLAHIRSLFPNGTVGTITVEGVKIDMSEGDAALGKLTKTIKEKINDPVNATVKKLRENQIYNDEVMDFTIELDGHKVEFKVSVEREAVYENGKMRTVVHKFTTYGSPSLGVDAHMKSAKSVGDHLNDILDEVVSGRDNTDRIDAYKAKIERINRENEQLQQRVGMEFQYDKELEQARKNVEEYTELMKQEMKEKEAKYAAQQEEAGDGGFDLHKAEESEEEDEDVRYSAAEDDLDEEALIIAQAKATDTYMRAPNGKPTNLNERQWVQVRTQAFKDWFGDWENDPENASQVVDKNGEPKVMYHSTNLEWVNKGEPFWEFYEDSHFGTKGQALDRMPAKSGVKLYEVFLNIRNAQRRADADQEYLEEKDMTMSEYWEQCARRSKYNGYDGIVYLNEYEDKEHPADSWIAFSPEQVKSADENVGTFDPSDPDIRHREAERFTEGQTFPIRTDGTAYSTDLMPDLYDSKQQLLDAVRRQYPEYFATIEDEDVRMRSWSAALGDARKARTAKDRRGTESYVERKTRNAINAVTEMANRMGLDVEILTTTDDLKGKKARSKGWFNPKTGKITLVLPNNVNLSDLINTLLHEGVAHYGLRKMFGSNFDTFLDNIYNNVSPEVRAIIDASMKRNKWSRHEATEEYLARLAERTDFEHATQQGWWRKIKDFFIGMLAKVGFNVSLSDNDLRYILWRSHENLVHPGRYRNVFEDARDAAMQAQLQVGRFARERDRLQRTGRTDTSRIAAAAEYVADGGELFRDDDDDIAKDIYEDFVAKESFKFKENWQDSMASLKAIQKAIAAETGNVATGAEDAYRFENRMHGRAKNMTEKYDYGFYRPMLKAFHEFCKHCNMSIEHGMDYLISKSGLERNVYYAFRDAARAKITDDINEEREDLEKQYAKGRMSEDDYKAKRQELEEREQNGADEFMKQVRALFPYQHAKQQYENGAIDYTEYLRIIETVIHGQLMRKKPKKDADGNIISDNYYDDQLKDYSGLTETFAKDMYDEAQSVKKRAQRTIDPDERKALWHEYDEKMRQAYGVARQVAEDQVFAAEQYNGNGNPAETYRHTKRLWDAINAATKETLRHSYESGLIDRTNYYKVRDMFDWYIPLRGWEEDKASDVYTYMGRDNVFSPAVKKVWGRQSKAENPLAYVGNIAVSTILSGHRNQLKQHFLNYVMNNPTSLVSISESWYENIAADGERPVWVLRTADTAGKAPDEIAQIVNDFNEEMRQKQNEGKAMPVKGRLRLDVHATSGQKSEHVVEVQRAGHTYQLYINGDPKAAQALNGSAARAVSRISDTWLGKKITRINRDMAAFFTSKNPAFVVSNLSRDLNMAGASVAINEGQAYNARFIANVAKVLTPRLGESSKWVPASKQPTGLMPSLMRKWQNGTLDPHDETERLFGEFMDEGGETGFVNMLSIDSFKERMNKEIREMNGSSLFGAKAKVKECSTRKALRLLGETFEFYNRCAEDATRFIVYMTSRQMGKTLEESIADAKDVTLNFNRKGTGGMGNAEVRDLFIFVNPAIQALANMYRMAAHHPLKFGAVTAAFVAGGALMPVINQWLLQLLGDDDDKQAYWNLPPWVRKNNLVFWIPGTKNFVTIPLAQEFRVFYGVGEMISSAIMDHPVDKWGLEVFSSVADLVPINPTGNGGNLLIDFSPTFWQPIQQIAANVDFTGKPIWRNNQGNKYDPMYTKAYVSTPTWMVKMSENINYLTGGDADERGLLEQYTAGQYLNNPAVWNHLLQGYFGGMYNTIAKTVDVAATIAYLEKPHIYQLPVLNRFINRPIERKGGNALGEDYWNLVSEAEELRHIISKKRQRAAKGDTDAEKRLNELLSSEDAHRADVVLHYKSIIDGLRKEEREATDETDKELKNKSIRLYKRQMLDELNALAEGKDLLQMAISEFDASKSAGDDEELLFKARRISKEAGASRDPYGKADDNSKAGALYQKLRNGNDIMEDALLYSYQEKAKEAGNDALKDEISKARRGIRDYARNYYDFGETYGLDSLGMSYIRRERKRLLKKYETK